MTPPMITPAVFRCVESAPLLGVFGLGVGLGLAVGLLLVLLVVLGPRRVIR